MSDCPSLNSWYTAGYRWRKSGQWPRVVWRWSRHRPCTGETARVLGQTLVVLRTQATHRPMAGHGTSLPAVWSWEMTWATPVLDHQARTKCPVSATGCCGRPCQMRLMGSGSASEACLQQCAIQTQRYVYFTFQSGQAEAYKQLKQNSKLASV